MKKIILALIVLLIANNTVFAQSVSDTIIVTRAINSQFTLTAPQKFFSNYEWHLPNGSIMSGQTVQLSYNSYSTQYLISHAFDNCPDIFQDKVFKVIVNADTTNNSDIGYVNLYPNPIHETGPYFTVSAIKDNLDATISIKNINGNSALYETQAGLFLGTNSFDFTSQMKNELNGTYVLTFVCGSYIKTITFVKQ